MLNYCNNVLLIACLYYNIMQMVTVALYVFWLFLRLLCSDDVLHV